MREARLGLGYIYLSRGHFSKGRQQFQGLLHGRGDDYQALLGRGATFVEEGITLEDSQSRKRQLEAALADFENALKHDPDSLQALYNKTLTIYELGRHDE